MNSHKNARLTFIRRLDLVLEITDHHRPISPVAVAYGVSSGTARKWLGRYLAEGEAALMDRSSRPVVSPRAIAPAKALTIVELRKKRMTQYRIADYLQVSRATVSLVLKRAGLARLSDLEPAEPVVRYEHDRPGDLIHLDTKKLVRIERTGHRIHGDRSTKAEGAGWETLFVAIDDHARVAFTDIYPGLETQQTACQFLFNAHHYFRSLGVRPKAILTDNGGVFRRKSFQAIREALRLKHRFTRPYRPNPTAKPNASSSLPCANGRTASPTTIRTNAPPY